MSPRGESDKSSWRDRATAFSQHVLSLPRWLASLLPGLMSLFRRRYLDADLDAEIRAHLEMAEEEYRARGMSAEESRRAARRDFGGVDQVKERHREVRGWVWLERLGQDVRLGVRRILRVPGASLTVFVALSLGIGLSTLMFSLIDGGILPTLPVPNGDRIVRIQRTEFSPISAETIEVWKERQTAFEGLGVSFARSVGLGVSGRGSEPVRSAAIDVETLPLLSVRPALGRRFTDADAAPGAPAVVLLGHDVWRSRLDADPDVLGRTVRVNGEPAEVVGVLPEGFAFPFSEQLWTPLRLDALRPDDNPEVLTVFGLLREGVRRGDAAAELNALDRALPRPASQPTPPPVDVVAYTNIINPSIMSYVLAALMLGVAFLVLLVACANATNVLLAQTTVRGREVALRSALGASRARIATQFWTEVAVLAAAGAVGGILLSVLGLRMVRNAIPPGEAIPFWIDPRMDLAVLSFVVAAAAVAAMLAGVLPALHASRGNRHELLKEGARGASSGRLGRVMGRLIGAEMAVSFVLLVAAGLFVRSALNLRSYDFSFDPEGVYTAVVRIPDDAYPAAPDRAALVERLEETLTALPGATSATLTTAVPGVGGLTRTVAVEGMEEPAEGDLPWTRTAAVTAGFFETFRASVVAGRGFDEGDRAGELPVAIVNRAFQETYLPGGAVGRRVSLAGPEGDGAWLTVVGVAPDLMAGGLDREVEAAVYRPLTQAAPPRFQVAVRTEGPVSALAGPIREAVASVDPALSLSFMRPLDVAIDRANAQWAWLSALFLVAGGMALFLAAVGLYGVMAFWVARRRREIGVRMALGGDRGTIVGFVVRQGMTPTAVGLAVGAVLAAPVAWLFRGGLLRVQPFDPLVFGGVLGVLLAAGVLGCLLPAIRATRVDPRVALGAE